MVRASFCVRHQRRVLGIAERLEPLRPRHDGATENPKLRGGRRRVHTLYDDSRRKLPIHESDDVPSKIAWAVTEQVPIPLERFGCSEGKRFGIMGVLKIAHHQQLLTRLEKGRAFDGFEWHVIQTVK